MAETPNLKDQAAQVLQSLIESAAQAGDFIKEQMPLVIQELLAFNIAQAILLIVLGVLILAGSYWGSKKILSDGDGVGMHPELVLTIFPAIAGCALVGFNTLELLKLTLAPRIWLIEYAAHLVK